MLTSDHELDIFKRDISLVEYAASLGYDLDRRSSCRSSAVLSHSNGDKIVVGREQDGHWIYFSVREDTDNGSIIDFVQRRSGGSLGEVRRALRGWTSCTTSSPCGNSLTLEPCSKDSLHVRREIERTRFVTRHHYLESVRAIPRHVLEHPRFAEAVRVDGRGNAIFAHENADGLCGFEIKNRNFTGFSPGGKKGLWKSAEFPGDNAVVICESGIDALSHFALKRPERTRYISIAGSMNSYQPLLLQNAANALLEPRRVFIATDRDAGGERLAVSIKEAVSRIKSEISEDRPSFSGDWNDVLRETLKSR